jgi:DDE superfamily endonuclease/Helix-turn-helix of DDE superfamily endonuclease
MTSYEKARNNPRQFKSLTSLSIEKFDILLPTFESKWESFIEKYNLDGTPRLRKYVPKNEKQLPTVGDKLFFLLFYKKTHSLQEVMAFQFDLDVSMVNKWIHILTPLLNKSLEKYIPKTTIEDIDFQIDEVYIIDGTERPIQRDTYDQETFYSGKKKVHTLKNALIVSTLGLIMWLGETHVGKVHDKPMVKSLKFNTPITLLADLGFKGWKPQNVTLILPHKKPRNTKTEKKDLTQDQKDFNRELSKKRVKVENVLAHIKILRIVKDKNRNYRFGFRENLMKTACGLYNFRQSA